MPVREACVQSLPEALHAQQQGASRLELCARLDLDGITPDPVLISEILSAVQIPVKVMIRPRGGDFVYTDAEFNEMLDAIGICKTLGVQEIVTGVLLNNHSLDIDRIRTLVTAAFPMRTTIHKCIDQVPDILSAIDVLKTIPGVGAILSSGQALTAQEGIPMLRRMLATCGNDLTLIVAGKVTRESLQELHAEIGAEEYHGRKVV